MSNNLKEIEILNNFSKNTISKTNLLLGKNRKTNELVIGDFNNSNHLFLYGNIDSQVTNYRNQLIISLIKLNKPTELEFIFASEEIKGLHLIEKNFTKYIRDNKVISDKEEIISLFKNFEFKENNKKTVIVLDTLHTLMENKDFEKLMVAFLNKIKNTNTFIILVNRNANELKTPYEIIDTISNKVILKTVNEKFSNIYLDKAFNASEIYSNEGFVVINNSTTLVVGNLMESAHYLKIN